MYIFVCCKVAVLRELFATNITLERLLARMDPRMLLEVAVLRESRRARRTLVRLLTGVYLVMLVQTVFPGKPGIANAA